jgi:hypothetical protein
VIIADIRAIPVSALPILGTPLPGLIFLRNPIKILNSLQNQNILEKFSTTNRSKHYFCLDTSLNRTLAYGH